MAFCWFRASTDVTVVTGDGLVQPSGLAENALPSGERGTLSWEMCKRGGGGLCNGAHLGFVGGSGADGCGSDGSTWLWGMTGRLRGDATGCCGLTQLSLMSESSLRGVSY